MPLRSCPFCGGLMLPSWFSYGIHRMAIWQCFVCDWWDSQDEEEKEKLSKQETTKNRTKRKKTEAVHETPNPDR
jgi:hypothetical protein